jgi:hypothetical protein
MPSIAKANTAVAQYGQLMVLPAERPLATSIEDTADGSGARKAVRERMHTFFHSISNSHHIAPSRLGLICALWRLDCANSPSPSDVVSIRNVKAFDHEVAADTSSSVYTVKDLKGLQAFNPASNDIAAHRAACLEMMSVSRNAAKHFTSLAKLRVMDEEQLGRFKRINASAGATSTRGAGESAHAPQRPSDIAHRFQALLTDLTQ